VWCGAAVSSTSAPHAAWRCEERDALKRWRACFDDRVVLAKCWAARTQQARYRRAEARAGFQFEGNRARVAESRPNSCGGHQAR
jgi:hypothetical protein